MAEEGNKRQGEDNDLLEMGFRRLFLSHGSDGSDAKGSVLCAPVGGELGTQPALWPRELEGTDCDQGQPLFLEEVLSTILYLWSIKERRD